MSSRNDRTPAASRHARHGGEQRFHERAQLVGRRRARAPPELGLALGIAGSGIGLGIFVVVPLYQALIDALGWRWAFRVLGVLAAAWIVPAAWLAVRDDASAAGPGAARSVRPAVVAASSGARDLAAGAALLTLPFWLIVGAKFLGNVASQACGTSFYPARCPGSPLGRTRR